MLVVVVVVLVVMMVHQFLVLEFQWCYVMLCCVVLCWAGKKKGGSPRLAGGRSVGCEKWTVS